MGVSEFLFYVCVQKKVIEYWMLAIRYWFLDRTESISDTKYLVASQTWDFFDAVGLCV
jgi:hypothetical protein